MVSDEQLIERIREVLGTSDLNTTTNASVRRKLELDFEIDLCDRKLFIREQVDLFLQNQYEEDDYYYDGAEEVEHTAAKVKSEEGSFGDGDGCEDAVEGPSHGLGPKERKRSKKTDGEGKKRGSGFDKICALSPQLQKIIGMPQLARTEIVKQVWTYIREKTTQDWNIKNSIICDEPLHSLFGVDSINMSQMTKALSEHIFPLESDDGALVKPKPKKRLKPQRAVEPEQKEIHPRGGKGFLAPLPVSDAMKKFLGTGENELSRADAVKRIWNHIKQNNLQDPSDKKMVVCDEKLKELFGVDTFHGFFVSKLLSGHLLKTRH